MKSFIISVGIALLIITSWCFYYFYSLEELRIITNDLDRACMSVLQKKWSETYKIVEKSQERWREYSKIGGLVINKETMITIDDEFYRALRFITAKDESNSSGEINSISLEIRYITELEKPSIDNII